MGTRANCCLSDVKHLLQDTKSLGIEAASTFHSQHDFTSQYNLEPSGEDILSRGYATLSSAILLNKTTK